MNLGIELHDSTVVEVVQDGTTVKVVLKAIVHETSGSPGIDAGEVCLQRAEIIVTGVNSTVHSGFAGEKISDGSLRIGSRLIENVIPLFVDHADSPELTLVLSNGERFILRGKTVRIDLANSREYLEAFDAQ